MSELRRVLLGVLWVVLLVLGSCFSGGLGGTGSIGGFGSIFVNGIEWDTQYADVVLDDVEGTPADLRLGMVVRVKGDPIDAVTAIARDVVFDDSIEGPVASIQSPSPDVKELSILGQVVVLDAGLTVFDDSDPAFAFGSVAVDDVLEVSGHVDGDGTILATWVRRLGVLALGTTHVELEGQVSALGSGPTFEIGPILVTTDSGTEIDVSLVDGVPVEVEGVLIAPQSVLASSIEEPRKVPQGLSTATLEGFVTDFVGIDDFRVDGVAIDASAATLDPPTGWTLGEGMVVDLEGPVIDGVVQATEVSLEYPEVELMAEIAAQADIDAAGDRVRLLGIWVEVPPDAELEDHMQNLRNFGLDDLASGDALEIEARQFPDGAIRASKLVRLDRVQEVELVGPLTGFDAASSSLEVLGVAIGIDAATRFRSETGGALASAAFFSRLVPGRVVAVTRDTGASMSEIGIADEIEVEH